MAGNRNIQKVGGGSTSASDLTSGTLNDARLSANVTIQGNSFNGSSQLIQTTAAGKYPALDGSLITNLPASGFAPDLFVLQKTDGSWQSSDTYATLLAATALDPASTINVGPGTYDLRDLLRDLMNLHLAPGAVINHTTAEDGAIIDDSAYGANGPLRCTIGGYGQFIQAASGTGNYTINLTNADSKVVMYGELVKTTTGFFNVNVTGGAEFYAPFVDTFESPVNNAVNVYSNGTGTVVDIYARELNATGTGGPAATKCDGGTQTVHASTFNGVIKNESILGTATQSIVADTIMSPSGDVVRCASGLQNITSRQIIGGSSGQTVYISGGTQVVTSPTITNGGGSFYYCVYGSGGTQRIRGARMERSNSFGKVGYLGGQTLILENGCTLIAGDDAAISLYADSAQNVYIYGDTVANYDKHSNVTVKVGTLTVPGSPSDVK